MNSKEKALLVEYAKLPYAVTLTRDEDNDVVAEIRDLEGCVAHGENEIEALGNLQQVKLFWIEAALKAGLTIPEPQANNDSLPSGKFVARVPRTLHKRLIELSKREGVSLNQLVVVALAEIVGRKDQPLQQIRIGAGVSQAYRGASSQSKVVMISERPLKGSQVGSPIEKQFLEHLLALPYSSAGYEIRGTMRASALPNELAYSSAKEFAVG